MEPRPISDALMAALKRTGIGYDPRILSITLKTSANEPHTLPLIPGMSFATVPASRELLPEEVAHERAHSIGGAPGAILGAALGNAIGAEDAYTQPDEAISYMMQPVSEATDRDMKAIQDIVKTKPGLYNRLLEYFAVRKAR